MDVQVRPADESELIDAIRGLTAAGTPAQVNGAGTKQRFGRPVNAGVTLQLDGLTGIQAYAPDELTLTCGAGTSLETVESLLREHDQELAFEPPDLGPLYGAPPGGATIGGVLGCNLAGSRRVRAGGARDHFLGFRAVSGRGEAFKAGGHVVKNVTGYDLCKLLAGSFGTLAALSEVTVKVLPRAGRTGTLLLPGQSVADAVGLLIAAWQSRLEPSGLGCVPPEIVPLLPPGLPADAGCIAAIRFEGPEGSVLDRLTRMRDQLGGASLQLGDEESRAVWKALTDAAPFADAASVQAERPLWRLSLPPASAASVIDRLVGRPGGSWLLDGGMLWFAPAGDASASTEVRAETERVGGAATLLRAPPSVRAAEGVFPRQSDGIERIAAAIRSGFDPAGVLNPGRMGA